MRVNARTLWAWDTDPTTAFDTIDHDHLLTMISEFPAKGIIRQWLKAGVVDRGRFTPTEEGAARGGVISPLLLNVALHGLEEAAGVRYYSTGNYAGQSQPGPPMLVRYADDGAPRTRLEVPMEKQGMSGSGVVLMMEVGPAGSPCRGRSRTTASC